MRLEIHIDQYVNVEVDTAELIEAISTLPADQSQQSFIAAINSAYGVLKRIPDAAIAELTPRQSELIVAALRAELCRYDCATGANGGG